LLRIVCFGFALCVVSSIMAYITRAHPPSWSKERTHEGTGVNKPGPVPVEWSDFDFGVCAGPGRAQPGRGTPPTSDRRQATIGRGGGMANHTQ
jgi:hypothetical protein